MTVYDVLDYLASSMTEDEILHDFPDLTSEDIRACLASPRTVNAGCRRGCARCSPACFQNQPTSAVAD
jgi:hypothetical protein